jgi:SAM-dependent methyltransferase
MLRSSFTKTEFYKISYLPQTVVTMQHQLEIDNNFQQEIQAKSKYLKGNDREFFLRVWSTDNNLYKKRLKAIGFTKLNKVLDAGCGFGQWAATLAELNNSVWAIDNCEIRVTLLQEISELLALNNLHASVGSIEQIDFPDAEFDAVFCYSVILFTDYKRVVKEFMRVLKPGGKLYICANGLGWYLHNILSGHNASNNFDSKNMGIKAIENTFSYLSNGQRTLGEQIVIPGKDLASELVRNNFTIEGLNGEGQYSIDRSINPVSFFKDEYFGTEGVYEIVATKNFKALQL